MPDERYILTLTPDQEYIIEMACELFARLKLGQFFRITEMLLPLSAMNTDDYCRRRDDANDALNLAACLIYGRNGYNTPDAMKDEYWYRAWGVYEVLRYTRSWHDFPEGGITVNFDRPISYDGQPLPTCRVTAQEETSASPRFGQWINVSQYRPGRTGSYIVCTNTGTVCTAKYYATDDMSPGHWNGSVKDSIRWWMPLPERP